MAAPPEVVSELRVRLGSPSTSEIPDAELSSHLEAARVEVSRVAPRQGTAAVSLVSGVSEYELPEGAARVKKLLRQGRPAGPRLPAAESPPWEGGPADFLGRFSSASSWTDALEVRARDARDEQLYGGEVYVEGGLLIVEPAPSADEDATAVCSFPWSWEDLYGDEALAGAEAALEDVYLHASVPGFRRLASGQSRLRSVSRLGQSTAFSDGAQPAARADAAKAQWDAKYGRPRAAGRRS